ncbi:MAG: acetyl-CoA carboxylase biotin carboxyl carrier protein [Acidisphaera sp.]|nr:acetyl-CoA carboxylase biotin carboxyl carrier protein [Acidisphaera sp.]
MTRVPYDAEAIRALAAILNETGLAELEISDGDSRIRLVRGIAAAMQVGVAASPLPVAAPGMVPETANDDARHPGAVLSPMVGVAYLSPEPGAPPFVTPGQEVAAGQTLMLIEAMKTFNQIKAPKPGTVARILVATGAPVEYGEPLLILD